MKLKFTKMQGLGNDFVVIDAVRQNVQLTPELVRHIADRHFGVGCDQLLLVEPSTQAGVDFRYRIFNADGGEVEQCGNGARCFVRFVHDQRLTEKSEIRVETKRGIILPRLENDGQVTVDMGTPCFTPPDIPFVAEGPALTYPLQVGNELITISALSMGNPHAVQQVPDVDLAPVAQQGPLIEHHARFPQRVNAGFMQVVDPHNIRLRVHERGAGETLACGTGACAAAVAGIRLGQLASPVTVAMSGGVLSIRWDGGDAPVLMTGPAVSVFDGELSL
jgi:diaminopimelate epimerase